MAYENWRVEWAPTSRPDDPFPVWENLNPWVETVSSPWSAQTGRPTEFDISQPSSLALTLNNTDHRFAALTMARQIRITETIGYRTFPVFRGWIELPDISDWAEAGVDQVITVTAVDRLTRMDRARRFASTLDAHIVGSGGDALQAYYRLGDASAPVQEVTAGRPALRVVQTTIFGQLPAPTTALIQPGRGVAMPGDDLAGLLLSPIVVNDAMQGWVDLRGSVGPAITATTGQSVVIAAWVQLQPVDSGSNQKVISLDASVNYGGTVVTGTTFIHLDMPAPSTWRAHTLIGSPNGVGINGPPAAYGPMLVALRYHLVAGGVQEFWVNGVRYTATDTAPTPTSATFSNVRIGERCAGTISRAQVYVSTATSDHTFADHLAQLAVGREGLAGQTTGERIRTVAGYAGIPAGELLVDDGTVRMPRADLAGKTALTAAVEAETTERGLLLADRAGRLRFQGRTRRYF